MTSFGKCDHKPVDTRETQRPYTEEQKASGEEFGPVSSILMSRDFAVRSSVQSVGGASEAGIRGKLLLVLQVNCRSVCNKALEFWNVGDTYNPDVVIGTESWLKKDISNAEVFRADFTTYRRDWPSGWGGGSFICVKKSLTVWSYGWMRM